MAFPSSPSNGQKFTEGGVTYIYDSTYGVWDIFDPNQEISGSVLRSDTSDDYSGGILRFHNDSGIDVTNTGQINGLQVYQPTVNADALMSFHIAGDYAVHFGLDGNTNDLTVGGWSKGANKYKVWHAGNDGSGSGLDADLLDGLQASQFVRSDANDTMTGVLTMNNSISYNDVSRYWLNTATNWGIYWNTSNNQIQFHGAGNNRAYIDCDNGAFYSASTITAAGDVITNSDIRLKSDIKPIENPLQIVQSLEGKAYIKDDKASIGFIAQEVEEVLPMMVHTADDEMGTKSVNYQNMVAILVEAIKEQQKQIDELKEKLNGNS